MSSEGGYSGLRVLDPAAIERLAAEGVLRLPEAS